MSGILHLSCKQLFVYCITGIKSALNSRNRNMLKKRFVFDCVIVEVIDRITFIIECRKLLCLFFNMYLGQIETKM